MTYKEIKTIYEKCDLLEFTQKMQMQKQALGWTEPTGAFTTNQSCTTYNALGYPMNRCVECDGGKLFFF